MRIGVPKEIKTHEYRVGLTPAAVRELVAHGHQVARAEGAGTAIGFTDDAYRAAGADGRRRAAEMFAAAEMIVKVKEPQPGEIAPAARGPDPVHLPAPRRRPAADRGADALRRIAIAYETVTDRRGGLPLLAPMSEVAGRMRVQVGAHCLEKEQGGRACCWAACRACRRPRSWCWAAASPAPTPPAWPWAWRRDVTVIDQLAAAACELDMQFGAQLNTLYSTVDDDRGEVRHADLVIGAVLVPGAAAPKLVTRDMVRGCGRARCSWTSRSTRAAASRPSRRPLTPTRPMSTTASSTIASPTCRGRWRAPRRSRSNNATLPFMLALADKGWRRRWRDDPHLRRGLNVHAGQITHAAVAHDLGLPLTAAERALSD